MTCMNPTVRSYLHQTSWAIKAREILNKFILPTQRFASSFGLTEPATVKLGIFAIMKSFLMNATKEITKKMVA